MEALSSSVGEWVHLSVSVLLMIGVGIVGEVGGQVLANWLHPVAKREPVREKMTSIIAAVKGVLTVKVCSQYRPTGLQTSSRYTSDQRGTLWDMTAKSQRPTLWPHHRRV